MDQDIANLVAEVAATGAAWVNGDAGSFAAHASQKEDFSIMGPFGGPPAIGWTLYASVAPRVASQFKSGTSRTEIVSAHKSGDLLVLVQIEHQTVLFAGDDAPQDWNLRVTQVYRREDNQWRIVHRHADPLLAMRSMDEAKELARKK